ncbi:HAD family hydrolase [Paenibacillus sp. GYB003]|uniref:HAD family hydrolase n=1 Tax=Paenibacillus sp. GYB003 TaxID=2994392 RepID=UPI002F96CD2B
MSDKQAVFFDLFETLISEYEGGVRKVERANRVDAARLGLAHDVYRREWGARSRRRMTGEFADYFAAMKDLLDGQNVAVPDDVLRQMYEERVNEKKAAFRGVDPELLELLRRLKTNGLKLGLISNCTEEEVRGWADSGLPAFFDDVVFSYEVGLAKPDPAIYKLACDRLGVTAEASVFVGDGGSDELNGADRAGMTAYHAVWHLPPEMRDRHGGYPKLERPLQLLPIVT